MYNTKKLRKLLNEKNEVILKFAEIDKQVEKLKQEIVELQNIVDSPEEDWQEDNENDSFE